jgi:predicted Zn-dependent peptidase
MGAPILGTSDIIENMKRTSLEKYVSRFYSPSRTVISASGGISHDAMVEMTDKLYTNLPKGDPAEGQKAQYKGGEIRADKDLEQAHIILGFKGIARPDEDYFAVQALSTLLGGGMSSRLFQEVREKRGLVYSIYSFHFGYQDDGLFGIYAGTGPEKLGEIIPVICEEVQKISTSVTEQELERAKAQLRANMLMGRESMMTRADQQAKYMLFRNTTFDENVQLHAINDVDLKAIQRVCNRIFKTPLTLAALGPLAKLEPFDKIEKRLAP